MPASETMAPATAARFGSLDAGERAEDGGDEGQGAEDHRRQPTGDLLLRGVDERRSSRS